MICFYHLFMPGGDLRGGWRQLFHQQMSEYEDSGLVEAGCRLNLGVIGSEEDRAELKKRIAEHYPFITVVAEKDLSVNDDWYEGATLEALWDYCQSRAACGLPPEPVLYWHSKGAVTANKHTVAHRRIMTHFCVERWNLGMGAAMNGGGFDLAGVEWRHAGGWHFSGNFWWANSAYIATLPNPMTDCSVPGQYYCDNSRIRFEMWVGSGNPRVCNLFSSGGLNWYIQSLDRRQYAPVCKES